MISIIFCFGLCINITGGVCIIFAEHANANNHENSTVWENTTEAFNLIPNTISIIFLADALRRLRKIANGVLYIETWQLIWHGWSYFLILCAAWFLCIVSHNTLKHTNLFYYSYETFLIALFLCEMPFLYIINRVLNQAIVTKER